MSLLALKVGITIRNLTGSQYVYIRIQSPQTWTRDTHLVSGAQTRSLRDVIAYGGVRHHVVETCGEIGILPYLVLQAHACMLVTQSGLQIPFVERA